MEIAGASFGALTSCEGGVLLLRRRLRELAGVRARAGVPERETERPLRLRLRAGEPLRFEGILFFRFLRRLSGYTVARLSLCVCGCVCVCVRVYPGSGEGSGRAGVALACFLFE